jgi:hypothetical protein
MKSRFRQLRWSVLVVMIFPLLLAGQAFPRGFRGDPTSRPYGRYWGMRGMMEAAGMRFNRENEGLPTTQPTEAQWHEWSEYMKRELPNAWEAYQRQPVARQAKMRAQIFAKFQATEALRKSNQMELYSLRLRQQKLWDQVAGLIKQWRSAPLDQRPALRAQLRSKVKQATEAMFKEQEIRIKKLEQQLADAKNHLAEERNNLEAATDRHTSHLLEPGGVADEGEQVGSATTQPSGSLDH